MQGTQAYECVDEEWCFHLPCAWDRFISISTQFMQIAIQVELLLLVPSDNLCSCVNYSCATSGMNSLIIGYANGS